MLLVHAKYTIPAKILAEEHKENVEQSRRNDWQPPSPPEKPVPWFDAGACLADGPAHDDSCGKHESHENEAGQPNRFRRHRLDFQQI